jgi:LPXTG-motif cell wall-anchored protein
MLVIGVLALSVPAVTLAAGGSGSAGDQQYTDPFAGTSTPTSAAHTTSAPTATAIPTTTAPPAGAPTTSVTQTTPSPASATGTTISDPTATMASTSAHQLPYTGYDGWLAAAFGFAMVTGGLVLRRRVGRS